jgi:hypothetical protein
MQNGALVNNRWSRGRINLQDHTQVTQVGGIETPEINTFQEKKERSLIANPNCLLCALGAYSTATKAREGARAYR